MNVLRSKLRFAVGLGALLAALAGPSALAAAPPGGGAPLTLAGFAVDGAVERLSEPVVVEAGTAYAPAVDVFRALGGTGRWDAVAGVFSGRLGGREVRFRPGEATMRVDGRDFPLRARPRLLAQVPYIGLRDLARVAGRRVGWDGRVGVVLLGSGLAGDLPPARVAVNGAAFKTPLQPVLRGDSLFFPARTVLESLGYQTVWRAATGEVWFRNRGARGAFRVGDATLTLNGKRQRLAAAPVLINGSAYVPLSLLQAAGERVAWNPAAWAVVARRPTTGPAAFVENVLGDVRILRSGAAAPEPAAAGSELRPGDRLLTGAGASADVVLDDGSRLQVGEGAALEPAALGLRADASRNVSFRLIAGRVVARVAKLARKNSRFEIETPTGTAGVRGTAFLVEVAPKGRSLVAVFSGAVQVSGRGAGAREAVLVRPNEETVVESEAPPAAPASLRQVRVDPWLKDAVKEALLEEIEDRLPPAQPLPDRLLRTLADVKERKARPQDVALPPAERLLEETKAELGDLRDALRKVEEEDRTETEEVSKESGRSKGGAGDGADAGEQPNGGPAAAEPSAAEPNKDQVPGRGKEQLKEQGNEQPKEQPKEQQPPQGTGPEPARGEPPAQEPTAQEPPAQEPSAAEPGGESGGASSPDAPEEDPMLIWNPPPEEPEQPPPPREERGGKDEKKKSDGGGERKD